jgi:hypothetical protein
MQNGQIRWKMVKVDENYGNMKMIFSKKSQELAMVKEKITISRYFACEIKTSPGCLAQLPLPW